MRALCQQYRYLVSPKYWHEKVVNSINRGQIVSDLEELEVTTDEASLRADGFMKRGKRFVPRMILYGLLTAATVGTNNIAMEVLENHYKQNQDLYVRANHLRGDFVATLEGLNSGLFFKTFLPSLSLMAFHMGRRAFDPIIIKNIHRNAEASRYAKTSGRPREGEEKLVKDKRVV